MADRMELGRVTPWLKPHAVWRPGCPTFFQKAAECKDGWRVRLWSETWTSIGFSRVLVW